MSADFDSIPRICRAFVALLLIIGATSLALANPRCMADPISGLPLPDTLPGLCVDDSGLRLRIVHASPEGLLVVVTDAVEPSSNATATEGLRIQDGEALLIHCPTRPDGQAADACLLDYEGLVPGSAASIGFGTVQGRVTVNGSGAAECPSSLHVLAELRAADGQTFDLRGALVLARQSVTRDARLMWRDDDRVAACGSLFHELSLRSVAAPNQSAAAFTTPDSPSLSSDITSLDERQLSLLGDLLRLDDGQLDELGRRLSGPTSGAPPSPEPDQQSPEPGADPASSEGGTDGVLDDIFEKVKNVPADFQELKTRIPRRDGLRDTHLLVNVQDLRDLFSLTRDEVRGLINVAREQRKGFDGWLGSDLAACSAGTTCAQFKQDLSQLLDDFEQAQSFVSSVSCLDAPRPEPLGLQTGYLRTLLDRAPPVSLFVLSSFLDRLAPEPASYADTEGAVGGWRTMLRDVISQLPEELVTGLADACEGDPADLSLDGDPLKCRLLRPPATGVALKAVKGAGANAEKVASLINSAYAKWGQNLSGTGVVGGGGGAGTNFPNIIKTVTDLLEKIGKKLGTDNAQSALEDLIDDRDDCLEADSDIEEDLLECRVRSTHLLDPVAGFARRPTFQQAVDHVERNFGLFERCQSRGGCVKANLAGARQKLDLVASTYDDTLEGYALLCGAYCDLIGGGECKGGAGGTTGVGSRFVVQP